MWKSDCAKNNNGINCGTLRGAILVPDNRRNMENKQIRIIMCAQEISDLYIAYNDIAMAHEKCGHIIPEDAGNAINENFAKALVKKAREVIDIYESA